MVALMVTLIVPLMVTLIVGGRALFSLAFSCVSCTWRAISCVFFADRRHSGVFYREVFAFSGVLSSVCIQPPCSHKASMSQPC